MAEQTLYKMNIDKLFQIAISSAINAGEKILEIYNNENYNVQSKSNNTPITDADLKSNEIITNQLSVTNIPILSEEGNENLWCKTRGKEYYWLIDPLDGTKEFINRNGEFTVNIALMNNNKPIMGVIFIPEQKTIFGGIIGKGAWRWTDVEEANIKIEAGEKLPIENDNSKFIILGSKSFRNATTDKLIQKIKSTNKTVELNRVGSSLKFCHLATGQADIYPRLDNIMQWDVAAGIAILLAAEGGLSNMTDHSNEFFKNDDLTFEKFIAWRKGIDIKQYIN